MKLEAIWQVEGTLETVTPLHVGDGRTRKARDPDGGEIQTAAKTQDARGRIPGSSLKGGVRGGYSESDAAADEMFGVEQEGGLSQFLDAYSEEKLDWDKLVLGRTKIDELTGAAQDRLLFHLEVVPPKARFLVRVRGKAFEGKRWQDAAALIDTGLRRFDAGAIQLGAGESNNWGQCAWTLDAVRVMDAGARAVWLANPEPLDAALGRLDNRRAEMGAQTPAAVTRGKTLFLALRFDGHPFLVNDPRKTGRKESDKHAHEARRLEDGRLLLPAESFRGVLAHQAARIARTRGKNGERQEVARDASGQLPARDALTRLFGSAGWGSTIEVADFVEVSQPQRRFPDDPYIQEFLAVDRFTGGGSEQRKFDAKGGWEPVLAGALTVNLERLGAMGKLEPALGLLALTLRDLVEGDLAFGWGSGKGYGWAQVETGGMDAAQWIEQALAGWCAGNVVDWIGAWEASNG
jgi:hypothetical protein